MHSRNYTLRQLRGRRFIEGEADAFIYGGHSSVAQFLRHLITSIARDALLHVRHRDLRGLLATPARRAVFHATHFEGPSLGRSEAARRQRRRRPRPAPGARQPLATEENVSSALCSNTCPIVHLDVLEPRKVLCVSSHEDEVVDRCNRRDLSIDERTGSPKPIEPGPLKTVPSGRRLVVSNHREGGANDLVEIRLEGNSTPSRRQALGSINKLVPYNRRNRALTAMPFKPPNHGLVGHLLERRGNDVSVEQKAGAQNSTFRPVPLARSPSTKPDSRRMSSEPNLAQNAR